MKTDKNKQLMLARGSKTGAYDADAPDQWKFNLRHGKGEVKAHAWVQSQTICLGHESPFCVDEHGKPTYIEHMALACGWEEQTARNYLDKLAHQGRVRIENKRIWYAADVPLAYKELPDEVEEQQQVSEADCTNVQQERNKSEQSNSVQSYRDKFINDLPPKIRREALNKIDRFSEWRDGFINDGVAALRSIADEVEDITWMKIGVPKKRLPKRRLEKSRWVQLNLLEEPNFVQSCAEFVQSGESTSYKLEIKPLKFGQTDGEGYVSFMGSTPTPTPTKPIVSAAPLASVPVIEKTPPAGGRASLHSEEPPARPPGWHSKLKKILEALPLGTDLDEPMFLRIASHLREELLPQFKTAAEKATGIRKWSGYEAIAKQVQARGLVKVSSTAAGSGGEESYVERRAREIVERRRETVNGRS